MEFESISLNVLFRESESKSLVLPNFQRHFEWDVEKQKTLLASFLLHLPTGSILTLEGSDKDFAAREVCFPNQIIPSKSCKYLLDGQQRFSSFKNIFTNLYDDDSPDRWRDIYDNLFNKLQYRFYLKVEPNGIDPFGFEYLNFDQAAFENVLEPSLLEDTIITKQIYVKDSDKYYHPGFNPKKTNGKPIESQKRKLQIVKGLSEEKLIPLYELFNGDNYSIHVRVLNKIAFNHVEDLKIEFENKKNKIREILSGVEPNIDEYLDENDENQIQIAWTKLATNWVKEIQQFLSSRLELKMSEIALANDEVNKAFAIFEIINQPGTPLDEYDLTVAKAARDTSLKQLTLRIIDELEKDVVIPNSLLKNLKGKTLDRFTPRNFGLISDKAPAKEFKKRFLQILSLWVSCIKNNEDLNIRHLKRESILKLDETEINSNYEVAVKCVLRACMFLQFRCGIIKIDRVPFKLMIIPIAYVLRDDKIWEDETMLDKIEYWYWSSIFGGFYSTNQNQRSYEDIGNLEKFVSIGDPDIFKSRQKRILDVQDYSEKKVLMNKSEIPIPNSVYNSILQYILSNQPRDFLEKDTKIFINPWDISNKKIIDFGDEKKVLKIQDHHICPLYGKSTIELSSKELRKNKEEILNSVLNRTYISEYANGKIRSFSPKDYLKHVSEAAKYDHSIPRPIESKFEKKQSETVNTYYERVLEERYEEIKVNINDELDRLLIS